MVRVSSTEASGPRAPSLAGTGRQDVQGETLSRAQMGDAVLHEDVSANVVNVSPPAKAGGAAVLGGGGRERVGREGKGDEGTRAKVLARDLAPMSYAAILRNPRPRSLHLALCNDSVYFETAFVDVTCLPSAPGDSVAVGEEAADGQGLEDGASGQAEVTKETIKAWKTGVW